MRVTLAFNGLNLEIRIGVNPTDTKIIKVNNKTLDKPSKLFHATVLFLYPLKTLENQVF